MQQVFLSFDGKLSKPLHISRNPDICPMCHHKGIVVERHATFKTEKEAEICFQCVNEECKALFIGYYKYDSLMGILDLKELKPSEIANIEFSNEIRDCSHAFVEIFNQAAKAEVYGLSEIAGVGYRKAVEFLIKDFVIVDNESDTDKIRELPLGKCIKNYIDDPKIKACAERAVWLGNDETHYIQKWTNKDINDLKVLIKVAANWIENSILTNKYLDQMKEE